MTVKRDEPQYPGSPETVGTAQTAQQAGAPANKDKDKNKKPAAPPQPGQKVAAVPPKTPPATPPAPPSTTPAATNPPAQKTDDKTASKTQGNITEQQVPGNTPTSLQQGAGSSILESGENLGRETQKELVRLGCFTGAVTERWGKEGRAAIKRFNAVSRYSWDDWPKPDLLVSLKRYPDNYCKKCRAGGEDCEMAGTQPNKDTAPVTPPAVQPDKPSVTAAVPPQPGKLLAPPAEMPPVTPAPPSTGAPNVTPTAGAPAEQPKDQKTASKSEGSPNEDATPYLPPAVKPKTGQEDNSAEDEEEETPKKVRRGPVNDSEPTPRRTPKRRRPVAEEPKPKPKPQIVYRPRVERQYTPAPRSSSRANWDVRPQGVGR